MFTGIVKLPLNKPKIRVSVSLIVNSAIKHTTITSTKLNSLDYKYQRDKFFLTNPFSGKLEKFTYKALDSISENYFPK